MRLTGAKNGLHKPKRRNLIPKPNPAALADCPTRKDVTFDNGFVFGNNSTIRYAMQLYSASINTSYLLAVNVKMDDGNAPIVGTTQSTGDFVLTLAAQLANNITVTSIGSGVYRVSGVITTGTTLSSINVGVYKYNTQSTRGFVVVGNWALFRR